MRRAIVRKPAGALRINVTPMIDVVMVLIIFFLIVGKLAAARLEPVDLPGADAAGAPGAGDPLVINVLPDDRAGARIVIEGTQLEPASVESVVRETLVDSPGRGIQLRASRSLAYGQVRPVLEACRRGGASTVLLTTTSGRAGP